MTKINTSLTFLFDHSAILVRDIEQSTYFYGRILGLTEIVEKPNTDKIRWFSLGGPHALHIIEEQNFKPNENIGVHIALRVNKIDAFVLHLINNDIYFKNWLGFANETTLRPDGIRQLYLQDPDGYWIEVNGK